ncbi:hypothetical protein J4Q44_G00376840 [Coregonus suidteri]|uniref:Ig-like domain-containing protein n=1 Tax=Coregonus suidteri TaxID=861788 RepID=A0AAN8KLM8_9TELE
MYDSTKLHVSFQQICLWPSVSVSPQGLLYSGETVTLQCVIPGYTDWTLLLVQKQQQRLPDETSKVINITIPITQTGLVGQYRCEGTRTDRPQTSQPSGGHHYQCHCSAHGLSEDSHSTGSPLHWRDQSLCSVTYHTTQAGRTDVSETQQELPIQTRKNSISLPDQAGQYKCFGTRRGRPQKSYLSSALPIIITEKPIAVLTLQPNWTHIFIRETVTMRCDIQGGDTDWQYEWCKNGHPVYFNRKSEYRISPVNVSSSGSYTCEGVKGSKFSKTSDAVQLTVSDQPKAVLSIYPQWLNPGDSVSLSCEVDKTSTGWMFSWYRTVPTLTEQSYSFQRLPEAGNGTTEDSNTLIPAGPTPTGGYVCRAGRGDPVYDTLYSEPQFLWSGDLQPSVSLRISPNTTQHFTSKSLSLSCEEKGNSTGWRLMSYRERGVKVRSLCCSLSSLSSRSSWILYISPSRSGCGVWLLLVFYWSFSPGPAVEKSKQQRPPQPQSTNQDPQQDQGSTQGQAPDTGYTHQQHGGTNIYDTINPSDNNDNDAAGASAAGPSHVTYAQIQLNKLDKKKKVKRDYPKENPVYSEVKTGKATAAAGPVDVTYAEVDLQKKVKAKKKRETATPPEAEPVYSLVKPYTAPGKT